MLHNQRGSIYRLILGCLIGVAFLFALAWPQYTKHRNVVHLKQAAQWVKALAFAEQSYYQQHGIFTPKLRELEISLDCPLSYTENGPVFDCLEYVYSVEGQTIRAAHKHLPVWLEMTLPQGDISCQYPENDWAGQDLCRRLSQI